MSSIGCETKTSNQKLHIPLKISTKTISVGNSRNTISRSSVSQLVERYRTHFDGSAVAVSSLFPGKLEKYLFSFILRVRHGT